MESKKDGIGESVHNRTEIKVIGICRALLGSYREGLNEGMFGDKEKKCGHKEQRKYLTKQEAQKIHQVSYKRALTSSIFTFYNDIRVDFGDKQAGNFIYRYEIPAFIDKAVSGFSVTLFYDVHKNEKILAFRGLDIFRLNVAENPNIKGLGNSLKADIPLNICNDMISFTPIKYNLCKIIFMISL